VEAGVVDIAEFALLHKFLRLDVPGVVNHHVVYCEREPFLFCEFDQHFRVFGIGCHRLFGNDVFSRIQSFDRKRNMGGIVCGDINRLDLLVREHFIGGGIPFESESLRRGFTPLIDIGGCDEFRFPERCETRLVAGKTFFCNAILGNSAESDQAILHF